MATEEQVAPLVEREVALDIVRRGVMIAPLVLLVCGLLRGWDGVASAAVGLGIVLVNFLAAAAIMTRAAKSGPTAIGAAALGGYVVRLAVILVALVLLRHQPWIDLPTLGFVIVGTHLGLLVWEMKYVSLTLAAPGLKPARPSGDQ
ncbi:MAG TPA: ATP synthase subunit I [Acidimicrobiia bacterium]|nr:ATP synthase subunit I [Acidimicrobiia bacterium]